LALDLPLASSSPCVLPRVGPLVTRSAR
jgi:hypothetical protein